MDKSLTPKQNHEFITTLTDSIIKLIPIEVDGGSSKYFLIWHIGDATAAGLSSIKTETTSGISETFTWFSILPTKKGLGFGKRVLSIITEYITTQNVKYSTVKIPKNEKVESLEDLAKHTRELGYQKSYEFLEGDKTFVMYKKDLRK